MHNSPHVKKCGWASPAFPDLTNFNEFSAGIPYLPPTDCDPSEAIWSNKEPCE